jgi:hypothetical protein
MATPRRKVTANDVIAWIEEHCRVPEGRLVGEKIKLAPFQKEIIRLIYDNPAGTRRAFLSMGRKSAKGLALDTPIATPRGWTTMGALKVDDQVFDERGKPCRVQFVSPVHIGLRCWRLKFADGSEIVADEQHLWSTKHPIKGRRGRHWTVVTTPEIAAEVHVNRKDGGVEHAHKVPVAAALETPEADLPISPYVLGYWLGNGETKAARVTTGFQDFTGIRRHFEQELGFALSYPAASWRAPSWAISGGRLRRRLRKPYSISCALSAFSMTSIFRTSTNGPRANSDSPCCKALWTVTEAPTGAQQGRRVVISPTPTSGLLATRCS